ncbi:hypothetical protein [Adhaeribacter terreus]|uniref:T9SS type A sorting domain-containing protein n=1 Tax=Adhaeribacter terreus TaxID=529703 RepID=A0ABW0EBE2_9BACT
MKTTFTYLKLLLITCLLISTGKTQAQFTHFPTNGAPIFGKNPVAKGNLDDPDKKIWVKVNGKMAGPQPHNKMHPFVTPGSYVDLNFNINKAGNRYTLVSYTVDSVTGKRTIYDYQSNFYNATKPVQGNSNQQLVLIPTCKFEVYFVKGTLVTDFTVAPNAAITASGPAGNPYATDPAGNLVLDFANGGSGTCETCPTVISSTDCVFPRLLEVIDLPNQQKELIFSVINNINTNTNACGAGWPEIGDIIFTNINPVHTGNNQPYQFRYNYQLGPNIPSYPLSGVTPPLPNNYQGSFVFDQRNNHNVLDFDVYQSEIVRFRVSDAEYARLSSPANTVIPQICVELSNKHPEPHQTLPPVYCADIDFVCEAPEPEEVCTADSTSNFIAQIPEEFENDASGNFQVPVRIINLTNTPVSVVDITLGPNPLPILGPSSGAYAEGNYTWNAINDAVSNVTFNAVNTAGFINGNEEDFILTINMDDLLNSGGLLSIAVTAGSVTETLELEAGLCAIIVTLPVELINFKGKNTSEGIALNWTTASEKDNDRFEIERSANGRNFEKIAIIKGNGNSSNQINYNYLDGTANKGLNYYRLKQIDFNGAHEYSRIISVNNEGGRTNPLTVMLVPNPCHGENCTVRLQNSETNTPITIELQDLAGKTVFSKQIPGDQTSFELPKSVRGGGIYILSARNGRYATHQKVIMH